MTRTRILAVLVTGTLLLSVAAVMTRGERRAAGGGVACLYQNGELVREIDLDKVKTPYSFEILSEQGGSNTVSVERGRIRISQADCPDRICVNRGWISDGTEPIVCLPNKLLIEIVGGGEAFDAAAG